MPNQAAFTINGTPSENPVTGDRQYTAVNGETLTCTLEENPSAVLSVTFEVFNPADLQSPLASADAPLLTWNENGEASITLGDVDGAVTIDIPLPLPAPGTGIYSYIIRCTVATAGDGSPDSQQQVFERLVSTYSQTTTPPIRKTVPGESTQGFVRAWSDALNAMVDAAENDGGGSGDALIDRILTAPDEVGEVLIDVDGNVMLDE